MTDIRLALMTGVDIPIPECQVTLHQPTIKEISMIGERKFFTAAQVLCLNKNAYIEDEAVLENTNNFQIFMTIMTDKTTADKKADVIEVLTLLFPSYKVMFTPRALLLNSSNGNVMIDEDNFESLQEVFRQVFCLSSSNQDTFNPGNDAAKKIADKLMRARQRVAAQKGDQSDASMFGQYLSILTIGLNSMSMSDLMNLTMYQIYDLIERYHLYVNWDLDVRTRLAGGKPDSSPDNWMKIIH